jgi:hypothetical protein
MALQVYNVSMKVYAESQAEADALQAELLAFVREKREQGTAVTASKIMSAVRQFKNSIFVSNYLKL